MPPSHQYPFTPTPEPAPISAKKGWVHRHPYVTAAIGAVALVILALAIVAARAGVSVGGAPTNWVGAGSVFFTGGRNLTESQRLTAEEIIKLRSPDTQLAYIPIQTQGQGSGETDFGNDLAKLLSLLTQPQGTSSVTSVDVQSAFSFIPTGFISIDSPQRLSREAEVIKAYGNDIGTYIQGYESMHLNAPQILKDQAEDRTNPEKALNVKNLGYDMAALGRDLLQMQEVPKEAQAAHKALATSYRIAGTNLTKIADSTTDQQFLDAITVYNASAEALAKRFFALASIFSAHNVTFSSSEPGSVFMFNTNLSL
jgi:hypothetical protein